MDRVRVVALRDRVWFRPIEDDDLEVAIVPAAAGAVTGMFSPLTAEAAARRICSTAFVDLRGYHNGAEDVPNSLEARLELFGVLAVRGAIIDRLTDLNAEVTRGEAVSGSA